ncbi:MAG: hypothetical protein LBM93_11450 [Oscillospiraceae bacterium]|jgi:hypothetical protein|nr:hypothetical protein [Oscillospiraceae bacterium]
MKDTFVIAGREYTKEELIKGVRNPFFNDIGKKVELGILNEDYEVFKEMADEQGVRVEFIMQRALKLFAKEMRTIE